MDVSEEPARNFNRASQHTWQDEPPAEPIQVTQKEENGLEVADEVVELPQVMAFEPWLHRISQSHVLGRFYEPR